jgi:hypothetical protein
MTKRELQCLKEAYERAGYWQFFMPSTTKKLAALGYFEKACHGAFRDLQWRLTDAGKAAYEADHSARVAELRRRNGQN